MEHTRRRHVQASVFVGTKRVRNSHRSVIRGPDGDSHASACRTALAVCRFVREYVCPVEVLLRFIGKRPVGVEDQGTPRRLGFNRCFQIVTVDIIVIAEQARRGDRQRPIFTQTKSILDRNWIIVCRVHCDRYGCVGRGLVTVIQRVRKRVHPVEVRIRCVSERTIFL